MAEISSLINRVYDSNGAPSTQAFYGPYQTNDLQVAIDQVANGWTNSQLGGFPNVPKGFKFGVIDENNKFTEYIYCGSGNQISRDTVKACAGEGFTGGGGGTGGGSTVLVSPVITDNDATLLANITVEGTQYAIKAPSSGSVSIDSLPDSNSIDAGYDTGANGLLNRAPNMKCFADLALRVLQLETQLAGLRFAVSDDNNSNSGS